MKYLHLRSAWLSTKKAPKDSSEVPPTRFCAVSIGYTVKPNEETGEDGIYGQIAKCKRPDQFSRKISHLIIEGRSKKKGVVGLASIPEGFSAVDILTEMYHPDFGSEVR